MNIYSHDLELVRRLGHKCSILPGPKLKFMPVFTFNNKTVIIKRIFCIYNTLLEEFLRESFPEWAHIPSIFLPLISYVSGCSRKPKHVSFLFKTPSPCETWALASTWALGGGGGWEKFNFCLKSVSKFHPSNLSLQEKSCHCC